MKIKIGNKVYLQKYEVADTERRTKLFAKCVNDEFISGAGCFKKNGCHAFEFGIVFEKPESVKWLMEQDWIVDYDEYVKMSDSDLEKEIEQLENQELDFGNEFNHKDVDYRKEHFKEMKEKMDLMKHKISSLHFILYYKRKAIIFKFPEEYKYT